jgi:hypothetical protein
MLNPYGFSMVVLNCWHGGGTDMELLIRTVDKQPAVSMLSETSSQRGDVICALPDGWEWSAAERSNPDWIIVTAQITEVEADALLEESRANEPHYRRRLGIHLEGLTTGDVLTREQLLARVF